MYTIIYYILNNLIALYSKRDLVIGIILAIIDLKNDIKNHKDWREISSTKRKEIEERDIMK